MATEPERPEPNHLRRMLGIWAVVSLAGDLAYWFLAGPHIPPGAMTSSAGGAQEDFNVLFVIAFPVLFAIWTYLGYAAWNWRASRVKGESHIGPHARGNPRVELGWIAGTTVIVMALFVFGTVELVVPAGAGGGEGPNPIWTPASKSPLVVQVIAQQWKFTYRYPSFGGMETNSLVLPAGTAVAFHVTSLDVIHSFWAYQLGVKADANPQEDDVAYTTTEQVGTFEVRCSELCGLWHGAMFNSGRIVSKNAFEQWGKRTEAQLAANTKYLPPFAWTYVADANNADGGYYPGNDPYSKVETYGAKSPRG
jgi:cytochrome c oxidase subunit 2